MQSDSLESAEKLGDLFSGQGSSQKESSIGVSILPRGSFFPEVTEDTFCLKGRSTIVLFTLGRVVLLLLFLLELKIWSRSYWHYF